ncbi:NIPSNAP family protein [Kordiimonas gwangyangensis]|uniref:NIPSNAP family protein n=1 Tax=Kordiimonas gwangyangensis TaxID=288022 RepID=UPI0003AA8027|nr:NIPSNAP family protein [Kordiimonas gwangyangensis]
MITRRSLTGFFAASALAFAASTLTQAAALTESPIHQLRIYEIFDTNKDAFHDRFRDHAARIMKDRYGFNILEIWESKTAQKTRFVYLLRWDNEAALQDGWAGFMADEEWKQIKRETGAVHGSFVGGIDDLTLRMTDYSPGKVKPVE